MAAHLLATILLQKAHVKITSVLVPFIIFRGLSYFIDK